MASAYLLDKAVPNYWCGCQLLYVHVWLTFEQLPILQMRASKITLCLDSPCKNLDEKKEAYLGIPY